MATILLTVPNAQAVRIADAIAARYGYQSLLPDGSPNPQTKAEFLKLWIINTVKEAVREQEAEAAAAAAANATSADVKNNITIT